MSEKLHILALMTVTVTLVVGADGSTSIDGNSAGISSSADRSSFLARRRLADCIIIGGKTARSEPYHRSPVPVVVVSRSLINPIEDNRLAHCWNLSPEDALTRAQKTFGENVNIEGGTTIIKALIAANRIDALELSITEITGGENRIDVEKLLSNFSRVEERSVDGTRFISAAQKITPRIN